MYRIVICLFAILSPFINSLESQLHKTLTRNEVIKIFQASNNTVFNYEITYPKQVKIRKRSIETMFNVVYDDEIIQLYLHPVEEFLIGKHTKVWMARPDNNSLNNFHFQEIPNAIRNLNEFYHEDKTNTVVHIKTDKHGNKLLDGTIYDNLIIRPVPKEYLFGNSSHSNNNEAETMEFGWPHIIMKKSNNVYIDEKRLPIKKIPRSMTNRKRETIPILKDYNIVYPELLIFVDEKLFETLGRDVQYTVKYIITTYYGVDLRYRDLKNPKIRFSIAGIIIVNGSTSLMLPRVYNNTGNPYSLIWDFGKYLPKINEQFKFKEHYDIAVFMTGIDMKSGNMFGNDTDTAPTPGIAFIKGACKVNTDEDDHKTIMFRGAAIVTDNGAYGGIHVIAHELGHVLGTPEDPVTGIDECKWDENGYIMSYFGTKFNRIKFSPCSKKSISKFLSSGKPKCLFNYPIKDELIKVPLPGELMTMNEQCQRTVGTNFCDVRKNDPYICVKLVCVNDDVNEETYDNCTETYFPPAEGTPCGNNKICLNGECVTYPIMKLREYQTTTTTTITTLKPIRINVECDYLAQMYSYLSSQHSTIKQTTF